MAFPCLNILIVLSSFSIIIIGGIPQITATAVDINHETQGEKFVKGIVHGERMISQVIGTAGEVDYRTHGEKFIKNIVHGEKLSEMPEYLLFTAPYRLCEGGCKDSRNFVMAFPLYVGKNGKQQYKNVYQRDYNKILSTNPNAPFKKKTTRHPFTPCPTETTTETTTSTTSEPSTVDETETTYLNTKFNSILESEMPSQQSPISIEPSIIPEIEIPATTTEPSTIPETVPPARTTELKIIPETEPPATTTEKISTETEKLSDIITLIMSDEKETIIQENKLPIYSAIESDLSLYVTDLENAKQKLKINSILTTPRETYVTNANGIRCPIPIRNICEKKTTKKVSAKIVSLKFDDNIYDYKNRFDSMYYLYSD